MKQTVSVTFTVEVDLDPDRVNAEGESPGRGWFDYEHDRAALEADRGLGIAYASLTHLIQDHLSLFDGVFRTEGWHQTGSVEFRVRAYEPSELLPPSVQAEG